MSSDVIWHIRDKSVVTAMPPKHGSINLYVQGNQKARLDGQPRTSTSTLTQPLLNNDFFIFISEVYTSRCRWLLFYLGSFSFTPGAGFTFIWGVSLTDPKPDLLFCGEFLLHVTSFFFFFLLFL